jgi:hypothetical protein
MQDQNTSIRKLLNIQLKGFDSEQMHRYCVGGEGIKQEVVEETPFLLS